MVFRAAEAAPPKNVQLGRDLHCSNRTVGTWRRRDDARGCAGRQDAPRSGRPRTIASRTRGTTIAVASQWPPDQGRTGTRWTFDESVATRRGAMETQALSRSTMWRILHEGDLQPHKSAYGLKSHDATCASQADARCQRYVQALRAYHQGRCVICCDAQTGRHVLERPAQTQPAQPGKRARRAYASRRHGTRVWINA